jgi:GntR family transcriptional regulator
MLFDIHQEWPIPIFKQIINQVIYNIAAGVLEAGDSIPSVRELGPKLLVHPNTVAKAYQELQRRGVIAARRGKGMEVTPEARAICQEQRKEIVHRRIRDVLREAVSSALTPEEIRKVVEEELSRANSKRR